MADGKYVMKIPLVRYGKWWLNTDSGYLYDDQAVKDGLPEQEYGWRDILFGWLRTGPPKIIRGQPD